MKQIEKIAAGANFDAVSVGKSDELNDYVMELGSGVKIPGKVFGGTGHRQRILFPIVHARNGKRFPAYPPKSRGTLLLPQRVGRIPGGRAGLPRIRRECRAGCPGRKALGTQQRHPASACSTKAALSPPKMPPTASYCRNLSSGDIPNRNMGGPARLRAFRIFRYSLISLPGTNRQRRDSNNADSTPVTP